MAVRVTRLAFGLLVAVLLTGCRTRERAEAAPTRTPDRPMTHLRVASPLAPAGAARPVPRDPQPEATTVLTLTVYNLTVPTGTVSASDDFWKHVNEQALNVQSYDTLYQNGVRVGLASVGEWDYFRDIVDRHPAKTVSTNYSAAEVRASEIPIRSEIDGQTIFHLDPSGRLRGRTFDRCENFLSFTYGPAPRKPGHVRIAICPVVRVERTKLELASNGDSREVQVVRPEHFFDCSLTADVPLDGFLVVALSTEGRWPTSIGHAFFTTDTTAERMERLLLIVPRPARAVKT